MAAMDEADKVPVTVYLGVPSCGDAFTPSTRLVSRNDGSGWFLFDLGCIRTRSEIPRGLCGFAAKGGRGAVLSDRRAALDAVDAAPAETTRRPGRQLAEVPGRRGAPRAP